LDTVKGLVELVCRVSVDLTVSVDMAYISCNAGCATDIIETERGDKGISLEKE
jgi:hypothetical protein